MKNELVMYSFNKEPLIRSFKAKEVRGSYVVMFSKYLDSDYLSDDIDFVDWLYCKGIKWPVMYNWKMKGEVYQCSIHDKPVYFYDASHKYSFSLFVRWGEEKEDPTHKRNIVSNINKNTLYFLAISGHPSLTYISKEKLFSEDVRCLSFIWWLKREYGYSDMEALEILYQLPILKIKQ